MKVKQKDQDIVINRSVNHVRPAVNHENHYHDEDNTHLSFEYQIFPSKPVNEVATETAGHQLTQRHPQYQILRQCAVIISYLLIQLFSVQKYRIYTRQLIGCYHNQS